MMHYRLLPLLLVIVSGTCVAADVVSAITPACLRDKTSQTGALKTWLTGLNATLDKDVMFRASFHAWYTRNCKQQECGDSLVVAQGSMRPGQPSRFATDKKKLCVGVTLADVEHWIAIKQVNHTYFVTSAETFGS